jgi:hypothetical protein
MAEATTLRKVPLMLEAKALASSVLPVPGGPYLYGDKRVVM